MRVLNRALVIAVVMSLVLSGAAIASAVTVTHPTAGEPDLTPLSPNAISQAGGYRAENTCVSVCHGAQGDVTNNNHGLALRPITTNTASVWTFNPFTAALPGAADFMFGGQASGETTASWVQGGMAIGGETYIYQADGGAYDYPAVGNRLWNMDYANAIAPLRRGSFVPGYNNQSVLTTAYASQAAGINFFTGSDSATQAADEYGCVNCHSFGSTVVVDGGGVPTSYRIQEWGVTCVNCHGNNPGQAHSQANAVPFNSDTCYQCHNRSPFAASGINAARPQQIAMEVWENGAAKNNYMQGYELKDSPERSTHRDADNYTFSSQWCYRCHTDLGYMAHSKDGTDVPYVFTAETGLGATGSWAVTKANVNGVDCAVCHTSHGDEVGLNDFGNRIPPLLEYDEGGPAADAWRQCSDCHRARQRVVTGGVTVYSMLPYGGTFDYNANSLHASPQREVFLGYGGYGVSQVKSTHEAAGVWCQYCHMPNSVAEPTANTSHLFEIIDPSETYSTSSMTFDVYPAGATTTTPEPGGDASYPDDSCTGAGCHLPSAYDVETKGLAEAQDDQKAFLQERLDYWQAATADLLAQATAARAAVPVASRTTAAYKMANINYSMVNSDASLGAHNFNYAHSLLDWAIQTFEDIPVAQATDLTIAASNTNPDYNGSVTITGELSAASLPLGNQVVLLQSSPDGSSWSTLATLGSLTGDYSYTDTNLTSTQFYRWVFNGVADQYLPMTSPSIEVRPRVNLGTARAASTTVRRNVATRFSGTLTPQYPAGGQNVWIRTSFFRNGTWDPYNSGFAATNSNSGAGTVYARNLSFNTTGTWRCQAYFAPTATNAATYSRGWTFTVR